LDPDFQALVDWAKEYHRLTSLRRWIRWALVPIQSWGVTARNTKHLAEWDFDLRHEFHHPEFQAEMRQAGFVGRPCGKDDVQYHAGLSPAYKRPHRDSSTVQHELPWGWEWLPKALAADPGIPVV
jgi:hypothetical protein